MLEIRSLAPPEEIVRYLAVFERCFRFIRAAGMHRNRDRMLLGGHLADALHNVPALLCSFNTDEWNRGERFRSYLRGVDQVPRSHNAPPEVVKNCRSLMEPEARPGELGLSTDLTGWDLAPPEKLAGYLEVLYEACLSLRIMRNYGYPQENRTDTLWLTTDENWRPEGDDRGIECGWLAALYLPIPPALVHWRAFDEAAFWAGLESAWTQRYGAEEWERYGCKLKDRVM